MVAPPFFSRNSGGEDRLRAASEDAEERALRWLTASSYALVEPHAAELLRLTMLRSATNVPHAVLVPGSEETPGVARHVDAHHWLFSIARELEIPVLATPGASDVRRLSGASDRSLRSTVRAFSARADARRSFFEARSPVREASVASLSGWAAVWDPRLRPQFRGSSFSAGLLPGDYSLTLSGGGLVVGVLSLNVVFLDFLAGEPGEFVIDLPQLDAACGGSFVTWARAHDVVLTLSSRRWTTPGRVTDEVDAALRELSPAGLGALVAVHSHVVDETPLLERCDLSPSSRQDLRCRVWSVRSSKLSMESRVPAMRSLGQRADDALLRRVRVDLLRSMRQHPPTRESVDALIRATLPDLLSLNGFIARRYPRVADKIWPGHTYDARIELLLRAHAPSDVTEALIAEETRAVARFSGLLR